MSHNHSVIDLDKHFTIDPISRQITTQADKIKIMQHDHNSEIFTFEIPKNIEGHDMSQCNRAEVHFLNTSKDKTYESAGKHIVSDLHEKEGSSNTLMFSWLVSQSATMYAIDKMNYIPNKVKTKFRQRKDW